MADDNKEQSKLKNFSDEINKAIKGFKGVKWFSDFLKKLKEVQNEIKTYYDDKEKNLIRAYISAVYIHDSEKIKMYKRKKGMQPVITETTIFKEDAKKCFSCKKGNIEGILTKVEELEKYVKSKENEISKNKETKQKLKEEISTIKNILNKRMTKIEERINACNEWDNKKLIEITKASCPDYDDFEDIIKCDKIDRMFTKFLYEAKNVKLDENEYLAVPKIVKFKMKIPKQQDNP